MRFFISRPDNIVAIDNVAAAVDCSSVSSAIKYVIWNENGSGFIEPATGVALRTSFNDPSPYQGMINAWISAQVAAGITLPQAKAIKTSFINSIYLSKRKLPVTVTTTAGTLAWDATESAISQLSMLSAFAASVSTNTVIAAVISNVNSVVGMVNANGSVGNALITNSNSIAGTLNSLIGNGGSTGVGALESALDHYLEWVQQFNLFANTTPDPGGGSGG